MDNKSTSHEMKQCQGPQPGLSAESGPRQETSGPPTSLIQGLPLANDSSACNLTPFVPTLPKTEIRRASQFKGSCKTETEPNERHNAVGCQDISPEDISNEPCQATNYNADCSSFKGHQKSLPNNLTKTEKCQLKDEKRSSKSLRKDAQENQDVSHVPPDVNNEDFQEHVNNENKAKFQVDAPEGFTKKEEPDNDQKVKEGLQKWHRCKSSIAPGHLVAVRRCFGAYYHFMVYVGDGDVVHRTGRVDDWLYCRKGKIKKEKADDVIGQEDLVLIESGTWNGRNPRPAQEIIERALSKKGEKGFDLLFGNCEHFARWCRYGEACSKQADNLLLILQRTCCDLCCTLLSEYYSVLI